jgi:hypothetical protein
MQFKYLTGLYDEDFVNHYTPYLYMPARRMMRWYSFSEGIAGRLAMEQRQAQQDENNQNGIDPNGDGPFEREMKRRGAQVEKYPLTTTTGTTRVHEMVLLRRRVLEEKSTEAMKKMRAEMRRDAPSEWYDESHGPLNPVFLQAMQPHYQTQICDLPRQPIRHSEFLKTAQAGNQQ